MVKGTAFDAFKLLIAAVVAGAVLVILLSMINGFPTAPTPNDACQTAGGEFHYAYGGSYCDLDTTRCLWLQQKELWYCEDLSMGRQTLERALQERHYVDGEYQQCSEVVQVLLACVDGNQTDCDIIADARGR